MSDDAQQAARSVVLLLFTDVEGSTHLLQILGERYAAVLGRHHQMIRDALLRHRGREVDSAGDCFFAAFPDALCAVTAAVEIQQALAREPWPNAVHVRVRMGLHAGEPTITDGRYFGLDVHRAARISAAAHGGQVLLSATTRAQLGSAALPADAQVRELGSHRLKDLHYPETLFDLAIPGLPDRFPPLRSLGNRPNNLPAPPTAFIGRSQLVGDVRALLERHDARLITLTGAGGSGKTRLSLEVAAGLLDAFPDGVFQVQLASVADPELVGVTIAHALAIPEVPGRAALDSLTHQLASKRTLLVLDNFEHLVAAAPLVAQLLSACPQLKVLATSRAALNVRFEREYPVPPMKLPREVPRPPSGLPECESVRLFVERVRDFAHDFELTRENADAIAEICTRLDGLPLAIELCASRVKTLTPQALAARIGSRLDLLTRGSRDVEARQRTLRAAIEWSYNLLDAEQKALFRRVATFAGGFGIDSAEEVLADSRLARERVVDALGSLVDNSLLVRETVHGESRLRMLETVREYGLEQLRACGEDVAAHAAHAMHFVGMCERLAPQLMGKDQRRPVQRLLTEADNLRAALALGVERSDAGITSRLLQALLWLWIPQGLFDEGRAWAERALHSAELTGISRERGLLFDAAGWLAIFSGDYAAASQYCERALAMLTDAGAPSDVARTKMTLGITSAVLGRIPEGPQLLVEALGMYRELGEPYGTALALIALGEGARAGGDEAAARPCYEEALGLLRGIGNMYWPGQLLQNLAHFRLHQGDPGGAAELLAEALELGREYNYPMVVNLYVAAMGGVAVARGQIREGARLFGAASAAVQQLGATFEPLDQQELERNMATARSSLGDEAFERAFAEGSHWTLDEAIAATLPLRG